MPLKNWSVVPGSNTSAPPYGAPESSTKIKDYNDVARQIMADTRTMCASATVASAATCDLSTADEFWQTITGTTTITSFGTLPDGLFRFVTFSGALTLTHNATSLILLGGVNRTTAAGDCALYKSLGSGNWKEYFYSPVTATYQPIDATLTALAALATGADQLPYSTGADTFAQTALTAFARTLLDDADATTARATLGADNAANLTGNVAAARITTALNASGSAPIYACRAWVNFDGSGTVAIRASGNVSSITDLAVGQYTVNFTTAMPDAFYAVNAQVGQLDATGLNGETFVRNFASTAITVFTSNSSGAAADYTAVCVSVFR